MNGKYRITIALGLLLCNIVNLFAIDEIRISSKCTNLPPQIVQQAYGLDVTYKNPRGPNWKYDAPRKLNPVFQYSCDNSRGQQEEFITREGVTYKVPDQLNAHPLPRTAYDSGRTLCFKDTSGLLSRLYNDVSEWEKFPTGTFLSTTGGSPSVLNVPPTARCLKSFLKEVYDFIAKPESRFYFNETHPLLDPKLQALFKRISEDPNPSSPLYTELIQNYGTSYLKSASYGYGIHIYILSEKEIVFPKSIIEYESLLKLANASFPADPAKWFQNRIKQDPSSTTPPTVFIRSSNAAPFSQEINLVNGELKLLGVGIYPFTSEKKKMLESALRDYRAKSGAHK